jgi:hypothetical protein
VIAILVDFVIGFLVHTGMNGSAWFSVYMQASLCSYYETCWPRAHQLAVLYSDLWVNAMRKDKGDKLWPRDLSRMRSNMIINFICAAVQVC